MKLFDPTAPFRGLDLSGSQFSIPLGSLRRARGIAAEQRGSILSRNGHRDLLNPKYANSINSLYTFRGSVISADVIGRVIVDGVIVSTALNGSRLSFTVMPPSLHAQYAPGQSQTQLFNNLVAGESSYPDYLFIAGGGTHLKLDQAGGISNWGIEPPPDGFTAQKVAVRTRQIEQFEDQSSWAGVGATLADEATIKKEGVNSLKMTVVASTTGSAAKAVVLDLSSFSTGEESSSQDFISIWVRVNNPSNIEYLQIIFEIAGAGTFANNFFSRTIFTQTEVPSLTELIEQTKGVASTLNDTEETFIRGRDPNDPEFKNIQPDELKRILETLSQTTTVSGQDVWVRLRIPKQSFSKTGVTGASWDQITGIKMIVKTNSRGTAIVYWDDLAVVGGAGMLGAYRYFITYRNSVTGSRSNPNANYAAVEGVERQSIFLQDLPVSPDPQVDQREIWRTMGDGTIFFRAAVIEDNSTLSHEDTTSDFAELHSLSSTVPVLESLVLPFDNLYPTPLVGGMTAVWQGRHWWVRGETTLKQNQIVFSPIGRPESVEGYVTAQDVDASIHSIVVYGERLYCIGVKHFYTFLTTDQPFMLVRLEGSVGTTTDHTYTIKATPYGIVDQSVDGIRLFDGTRSALLAFEMVQPIFRGMSKENLTPFVGNVAAYGNDEYLISDGSQTLALNLRTRTWRDIGVGFTSLHFDQANKRFLGGLADGDVCEIESPGHLTDFSGAGEPIAFDVQFPGVFVGFNQAVVRLLIIDMNTNNQLIAPVIIIDDTEIALPNMFSSGRAKFEIPVGRAGRSIALRLTGNLTNQIEIFAADADIYLARSDRDASASIN